MPPGKPLWRHGYSSRFEDPYGYNNGPRATPLLTAERCYTFGAEGKLVCLDLDTGKIAEVLPAMKKRALEMWEEGERLTGHPGLPLAPTPNLAALAAE